MDRARRNAKIVKLVRARKLTMHEIGGMFDLTRGAVSVIAKAHGVAPGVRRLNPSKVLKAVRLIDRGMPVAHAAQTAGLRADSLKVHLANRGCISLRRAATVDGRIARCVCSVATTASRDIRCAQSGRARPHPKRG